MPVPSNLADKLASILVDARTIEGLVSQMQALQANPPQQNEAEWSRQGIIDLANRIVTIATALPLPVP